jgi:hypothetical protein
MKRRLPWDQLRTRLGQPVAALSPSQASELVLAFGKLAGWCLRPEVLTLAQADPSVAGRIRKDWSAIKQMPMEHGGCWIAFANDADWPLLRPAFALPLRWRAGAGHAPSLPPALVQLAERVVQDLAGEQAVAERSWGLEPATALADVDLAEVPLECASGWAALAAGLLVAAEGGMVNPQVWASAHWHQGIAPVRFLEDKIDLAAEFGAHTFFVPEQQKLDADRWVRDHGLPLAIGGLIPAERQPRMALKAYLQALKVRPARTDSHASRASFYLSPDLDDTAARAFYREMLMPDIVAACRQALPAHPTCQLAALVTIASDNSELVALGIEVLRPRHCLVLYTADYAQRTAAARALALNNQVGCQVAEQCFPTLADLRTDMASAIRHFLQPFAPHEVVFDLTPGPKDISFAWMLDIAPPQSHFYYLRHTIAERVRRPVPFSEQPRIWSADTPALAPLNS